MNRSNKLSFFAVTALTATAFLSLPAVSLAQETSTTTTKPMSMHKRVTIDSAQVVYVSGDDAVLKLPDGSLKLFELTPGASLTIDGKPATAADLTPGTTVSHVQVSSRVESEVTTVTQINGTVTSKHGQWVILRLDDGTSKSYRVPMHATFTVNGAPAQYADITKGMKISATAITTEGLSTHASQAGFVGQTPPQTGTLLILRK